eukprot:jgi/Botrbrau1/5869/Bobra.0366s0048.1
MSNSENSTDDSVTLGEEIDDLKSRPLRVASVKLHGGRTKKHIILREFDGIRKARTVEEVVKAAEEACDSLTALGVYDAVQIIIDEGEEGKENTCSMVVLLKEKRLFNLEGKTFVSGNEGSVELVLSLTNPSAYCERYQAGVSWGNASSYEYAVTVSRGRLGGKPYKGQVTVHQQLRSFLAPSSFLETVRGAAASVSTQDDRHTVGYDLSWRILNTPTLRASAGVTAQTGNKLKSALQYTFRHKTLDNLLFPTRGWGIRSTTELAGVGLDPNLLRAFRQEVSGMWVTPLAGGSVFALQAQGGVLVPWGPSWRDRQTYISDRFFLGGVGTGLRGFSYKGAGPADLRRQPLGSTPSEDVKDGPPPEYDSLGGDLYASVLASIRYKIAHPAAEAMNLYAQAFVNGGNIVGLTGQTRSFRDCVRDFGSGWRWSAGVGLVWPLPIGNVEINYSRVLNAQNLDRTVQGLQFGFSFSPF